LAALAPARVVVSSAWAESGAQVADETDASNLTGSSTADSAPAANRSPGDTTMPGYLEELRRLAQQTLADQDGSGGAVPAPPLRNRGLASSVDGYTRFVDRADLSGTIESDSVSLTRPVVPRMVVRDRDAISYLFACCAFGEVAADSIALVEVYDFGRSGFSNGDLMVCQPSGRSYLLEGLDDDFLAAAATWARAEQLEVTRYVRDTSLMDDLSAELAPPDTYDWEIPAPELPPDEDARQALRAIWAGIHEAVISQYGSAPVELYFARGDSTTGIEVWGYRPDSLQFQYLFPKVNPARHDLLTVTVSDTVIRGDAAYLDLLMIGERGGGHRVDEEGGR
jgi:hypothetical protein